MLFSFIGMNTYLVMKIHLVNDFAWCHLKCPGPEAVLWAITSSIETDEELRGNVFWQRVGLEVQLTAGRVSDYCSRYWGGFVITIFIFCQGMTDQSRIRSCDHIQTHTNYRITAINYDWFLDVAQYNTVLMLYISVSLSLSLSIYILYIWREYCIVLCTMQHLLYILYIYIYIYMYVYVCVCVYNTLYLK